MIDELNKDRLNKIVRLAKFGVGGEKENADRVVRKICAKYGLSYEEVMQGVGAQEFEMTCKTSEVPLLVQVICRYALLDADAGVKGGPTGRGIETIYFHTTKEKYEETVNAFHVLKRLFKEEEKKIRAAVADAFYIKHDLYYKMKPGEKRKREKKLTEKEIKEARIAMRLADGMEDAQLFKTIGYEK